MVGLSSVQSFGLCHDGSDSVLLRMISAAIDIRALCRPYGNGFGGHVNVQSEIAHRLSAAYFSTTCRTGRDTNTGHRVKVDGVAEISST